jgi:hypothetical protein
MISNALHLDIQVVGSQQISGKVWMQHTKERSRQAVLTNHREEDAKESTSKLCCTYKGLVPHLPLHWYTLLGRWKKSSTDG